MLLNDEEKSMLEGALGEPRRWAMDHMIKVGRFFGAQDFVPVSQAHMMADTESLGEEGVSFFEKMASFNKRDRLVKVPMITDPRGIDFKNYRKLKQTNQMAKIERRAIKAFEALGILMTDTCINYQTIMPPIRGEHLAYGDTGVVIYCNSVIGAFSNFEGGPSALAAGLTGRTPRYGVHLPNNRRATCHFQVEIQPETMTDWGALGAIIGQRAGSYWEVPVITGLTVSPSSDELKHFGAAMASYGSIPLFHIVGITPDSPSIKAIRNIDQIPCVSISKANLEDFFSKFSAKAAKIDVVVFSAPQLSIFELNSLADLLEGNSVHEDTTLLAVTSPQVGYEAERLGIKRRIEIAGGLVLQGMCFYQSYAREMAEANGWKTLMTNSVKLANIIGGYGYQPYLASMADCVKSALTGRIMRGK